MQIIHSTQVLSNTGSRGQKKYWQGHVSTDGDSFYTQASYWQETASGADSKVQFSEPYRVESKNVGRSNATSEKEQAFLEIEAFYKKLVDRKGYVAPGETSKTLLMPMLALEWKKRKHTVRYPVAVQRKYDGMRVLCDGEKMWSRGSKEVIPEVVEHLLFDTKGHIIDGELALPGNASLQASISAAKKFSEASRKLQFNVYDVVSDRPYQDRLAIIDEIVSHSPFGVMRVPTYFAQNEDEVMKIHNSHLDLEYEGTIVRALNTPYQSKRTDQLLKIKEWNDGEWKIVGVEDGNGKNEGIPKFKCDLGNGDTFDVDSIGSNEDRRKVYGDRDKLIGKMLTVRYRNLTPDGVPFHAKAVSIRDYELQG